MDLLGSVTVWLEPEDEGLELAIGFDTTPVAVALVLAVVVPESVAVASVEVAV